MNCRLKALSGNSGFKIFLTFSIKKLGQEFLENFLFQIENCLTRYNSEAAFRGKFYPRKNSDTVGLKKTGSQDFLIFSIWIFGKF